MLFSTPGGGRFSRAPPFTKTLQQATTFSLTSVKTRLIDVGPPAGLSHLPGDVLNPPRRLHLPGPFLETLQACTLPSYATAATRETGSWRGICKFANSPRLNLALVPAILACVESNLRFKC